MRRALYSTMYAPFWLGWGANSQSRAGDGRWRWAWREVLLDLGPEGFPAMADAARRLCRLLRFAARHLEPRLYRHRGAQRADAGTAGEGQPFDLPELVLGRVARDAHADRHLAERRCRRVGDHMPARVELRACDRLEAVVGDPKLGRVEGEHRGVAADRAGEQKFERAPRAILSAHMRRLADDEFEAAPLALHELVELTDRRHRDLDEALRSLGRRLVWVGAVAALARVGDLFQRGKAIADFGHPMSPETLDPHSDPFGPAKAGTQIKNSEQATLDSRFRGNERTRVSNRPGSTSPRPIRPD